MKTLRQTALIFGALIGGAVLLGAVGQISAAEADAKPTAVSSTISEVTVYADRARVTRMSAATSMSPGLVRVAFEKLPGWLDEGSVRLSLSPADAGEIADVQVEKTFLAKSDNEDIVKAEAAVTEMNDQLGTINDELSVLDAQSRQADSIRAFSLDKLPKDAAVREIKPEEYNTLVKFVGDTMLDLAKKRRELQKQQRDLQPELRARQQRLNDLRQRAQLEQRTVVAAIRVTRAVQGKVVLTYMLPGTTWEPVHELRAAPDGKTAQLASYAVVSQTTGEDWEGVPLIFSTQRPNDTVRIPELESMVLGGRAAVQMAANAPADTFQAAVANFDNNNGNWNTYANSTRADVQREWAGNVMQQTARQRRNVEVFQTVQKRGTTAQFATPGAQTVRSDGRPARVMLGSRQLPSVTKIIAAPEVSLNAAMTANLTNATTQPLLPGKVLLYAEGAFVGTTEMEFAAPGEGFPLFLGVADTVKLGRTLDQKRSSLTWSGKRKHVLASYSVTAENLADKPATLQLSDRIPVSETDQIRVINVKLPGDTKADLNGLVKWDSTLAAHEKAEYRIEYTIDYPTDLPKQPGSASGGSSEMLYRQIDVLEQSLKK